MFNVLMVEIMTCVVKEKKREGHAMYLWLTADLHSPLLFHTYRHCVKPLAANCFHITEQPGDLGGFPRPPTLGHGACTFTNADHQSDSGCITV